MLSLQHAIREVMIYIGIYSTISFFWRFYEQRRYGRPIPKNRDTVIALALALLLKITIL